MVAFTMHILRFLPVVVLLLGGGTSLAQSTYGVGSTPSEEDIRSWDISISPDGKELPPGSGTANVGAQLYLQKGCAGCHGMNLGDGMAPRLVKNDGPPNTDVWALGKVLPFRSPYATTVWDFINRGMPLGAEGTLTPDEVYSLVAFLLYKNDVIEENEILDAKSLPMVDMPIGDNWAPLPEWKHGMDRMEGYPY